MTFAPMREPPWPNPKRERGGIPAGSTPRPAMRGRTPPGAVDGRPPLGHHHHRTAGPPRRRCIHLDPRSCRPGLFQHSLVCKRLRNLSMLLRKVSIPFPERRCRTLAYKPNKPQKTFGGSSIERRAWVKVSPCATADSVCRRGNAQLAHARPHAVDVGTHRTLDSRALPRICSAPHHLQSPDGEGLGRRTEC